MDSAEELLAPLRLAVRQQVSVPARGASSGRSFPRPRAAPAPAILGPRALAAYPESDSRTPVAWFLDSFRVR